MVNAMRKKIVKNKINLQDILIILSIVTIGAGDLNGFFPINVSQIMILFLLIIVIINSIKNCKICFPKFIILIGLYIIIITFLLNRNDMENLKDIIMLLIYLFSIYNYVIYKNDIERFIVYIYNIGFYLSLIGILQQIGYKLKVESMYDFRYLGIYNSITEVTGFMRVTSVFTEPAHLSTILSVAIGIILLSNIKKYKFNSYKIYKNIIIIVCSFFTFSIVVYISIVIMVIYIFLTQVKNKKTKIKIVIFISLLLATIFIFFPEVKTVINNKLATITTVNKSLDVNNLSSFAINSNLKIAINKIKDGYIFGTGIGSHEKSYFSYIDRIYEGRNIVMYLNYNDAASIYIRIISEFGIFGITLYSIFLFKSLLFTSIKNNKNKGIFILNLISILGIINYGIRIGEYINPIFILFICISIITKKKIKKINMEQIWIEQGIF